MAISTTIRSISRSTSRAPPISRRCARPATPVFPTSGATAANTPFPFWRCIAQALQRDEPGEKCNGLLNRSHTGQHNIGFSAQGTWFETRGGWRNQFTAGTGYRPQQRRLPAAHRTRLSQSRSQRHRASARSATASPAATWTACRSTRASTSTAASTPAASTLTDTLSGKSWNFTLSGRYNHTTVDNRDRIRPSGADSLTGSHTFDRFNPAVGVTYSPVGSVNLYFSYSEGSRAPTSVELGCANPDQPCKLPNAMAGDPPLDQVVARTFEAGVRSGSEVQAGLERRLVPRPEFQRHSVRRLHPDRLRLFQELRQDPAAGPRSDLHAGRISRLSLGGGYTFLDATYQSTETLDGAGNSISLLAAPCLQNLKNLALRLPPVSLDMEIEILRAVVRLWMVEKLNLITWKLDISWAEWFSSMPNIRSIQWGVTEEVIPDDVSRTYDDCIKTIVRAFDNAFADSDIMSEIKIHIGF